MIGDKGYLINEKDKKDFKKLKINVVAPCGLLRLPKRKNQKSKNTDEELNCLKDRYKIENSIAKIKVFNRVHIRRDYLMCTYMGFVYMALIKISKN